MDNIKLEQNVRDIFKNKNFEDLCSLCNIDSKIISNPSFMEIFNDLVRKVDLSEGRLSVENDKNGLSITVKEYNFSDSGREQRMTISPNEISYGKCTRDYNTPRWNKLANFSLERISYDDNMGRLKVSNNSCTYVDNDIEERRHGNTSIERNSFGSVSYYDQNGIEVMMVSGHSKPRKFGFGNPISVVNYDFNRLLADVKYVTSGLESFEINNLRRDAFYDKIFYLYKDSIDKVRCICTDVNNHKTECLGYQFPLSGEYGITRFSCASLVHPSCLLTEEEFERQRAALYCNQDECNRLIEVEREKGKRYNTQTVDAAISSLEEVMAKYNSYNNGMSR